MHDLVDGLPVELFGQPIVKDSRLHKIFDTTYETSKYLFNPAAL